MEIIVPCAGLSSRFPGMRPKYLLTDYSCKMMIEKALQPYIGKHNITIVILKEHDEEYKAQIKLREAFGDTVNIVVLDEKTNGPAETVYRGIVNSGVVKTNKLLVKDCDSFYESREENGNAIYVSRLSKNLKVRNAAAKSYTVTNNQNVITTVVEKKIVSDNFCVGGYQFETAQSFINAYENIRSKEEVFVSHIIDYLITKGEVFIESEVENFVDVGTLEDWREYNNKPTYFSDIDGTIVKSKFNYNENYEPIENNIKFLLKELKRGCKVVFVTSRPKKHKDITRKMLDELGFQDCILLTDMNHSRRILINDFAKTNPYPTAVAVNIKRDDNNMEDYL